MSSSSLASYCSILVKYAHGPAKDAGLFLPCSFMDSLGLNTVYFYDPAIKLLVISILSLLSIFLFSLLLDSRYRLSPRRKFNPFARLSLLEITCRNFLAPFDFQLWKLSTASLLFFFILEPGIKMVLPFLLAASSTEILLS